MICESKVRLYIDDDFKNPKNIHISSGVEIKGGKPN